MTMPSPAKEAEPTQTSPVPKEKAVSLNTLRADVDGEEDFHVGCQRPEVFLSCVGLSPGPSAASQETAASRLVGKDTGRLQGLCSWVHPRSGALLSLTIVPWPLGAPKRLGNAVQLCALVNTLPQKEAPFLSLSF